MAGGSMQATVKWAGDGLLVGISPGGHAMAMDTNPERKSAVSPVEMVLLALGGCTGVDVVSILEKKRMKVTGYEAVVSAEREPEHPRKFRKLHVHHIVRGVGITPEAVARSIELSETKYCSVSASLRPGAEITSSFEILPDEPSAP